MFACPLGVGKSLYTAWTSFWVITACLWYNNNRIFCLVNKKAGIFLLFLIKYMDHQPLYNLIDGEIHDEQNVPSFNLALVLFAYFVKLVHISMPIYFNHHLYATQPYLSTNIQHFWRITWTENSILLTLSLTKSHKIQRIILIN